MAEPGIETPAGRRENWALQPGEIHARFKSRCLGCGEEISVGQRIRNVDKQWVHSPCPEVRADAEIPRGAVICGKCFCYHRGEC